MPEEVRIADVGFFLSSSFFFVLLLDCQLWRAARGVSRYAGLFDTLLPYAVVQQSYARCRAVLRNRLRWYQLPPHVNGCHFAITEQFRRDAPQYYYCCVMRLRAEYHGP